MISDMLNVHDILTMLLRIGLAVVLGGVIGVEREAKNRPAGLRTHILVCIGSATIMILSEFLFSKYKGLVSSDPARLGAQVISGIGFLGAGTIMRTGVNIKGLTTAATLWATACIGLSIGAGAYILSVISTLLVFFVLIVMSKLERIADDKRHKWSLSISVSRVPGKIDEIDSVLRQMSIEVQSIRFDHDGPNILNGPTVSLVYSVKPPMHAVLDDTIMRLKMIEGVADVFRS